MEYELKRHGITIPFDAIAKRLASEKDTTGACVQQHLSKLRKEMLARGSWVPPLSGKPNSKQQQSDVRGLVMVKKRNGECETREISWTEDAFKYVDLVHINQAKMIKYNKAFGDGGDTPGSAARPLKTKRPASNVPGDEVDPADLPSDEDFDPSNRKSKKAKRVTCASAKPAGNSNGSSYGTESDAGNESDSDGSDKKGGQRKPVMMALYQSEEEEEPFAGMVILRVAQHWLAEYPEGVNEAYRNTHGIQTGITNGQGEEVFDGDASDSDSIFDANTAENYAEAFGGDPDYSIMDANTAENYAEAFGGGLGYSIMDVTNPENYAEAFEDGDGEGSDSDSEEHQVNTAIPNASAHMVQSSNQVTGFDNMFGPALNPAQNSQYNNSSMAYQVNNQHAGQGTFMGINTPASTPVHNASGQSANGHNAVGSYTMGPNILGQNHFLSNTRVQDLFIGGPVNRAATGNFMGGQNTFGQNIPHQNALSSGSGHGFGLGTSMGNDFVMGDTTSPANDHFVSNEDRYDNRASGTQIGTGNNPGVPATTAENNPIDLNNTGRPMNDLGVNGTNGGDGTPRSSDDELQVQSYLDSFAVSEHLPLPGGRLLIRHRT